jgi:hypothetical protein
MTQSAHRHRARPAPPSFGAQGVVAAASRQERRFSATPAPWPSGGRTAALGVTGGDSPQPIQRTQSPTAAIGLT